MCVSPLVHPLNQGCKVIQITNIEAMKGTRCSHKGIFSCPIILIIGKKVVHSVKTAASKVCHLLLLVDVSPHCQARTCSCTPSEMWGAIQWDASQLSTDYNMYLCQSAPCDLKASENRLSETSWMLFKQDQIF